MEEELVSEIGNKFQIIYLLVLDKGHILNCLKLVRQNEVYTERQVEFQNGEPDYYLKRVVKAFRQKININKRSPVNIFLLPITPCTPFESCF